MSVLNNTVKFFLKHCALVIVLIIIILLIFFFSRHVLVNSIFWLKAFNYCRDSQTFFKMDPIEPIENIYLKYPWENKLKG